MTHVVHYVTTKGRSATVEIDLTQEFDWDARFPVEDCHHVETIHPADQDCPRCR